MQDTELRWFLKVDVSGNWPHTDYILQYRKKIQYMPEDGIRDWKWSEWQDVPTITEER